MSNYGPAIPQAAFEFDPAGIGQQSEFSITFRSSDVDTAKPLENPPEFISKLDSGSAMAEIILSAGMDNAVGSLAIDQKSSDYVVRFGFKPTPQFVDTSSRRGLAHEHDAVIVHAATLLNLQYHFGVPGRVVGLTPSLARLSFDRSDMSGIPNVVVGEDFERTLRSVGGHPEIATSLNGTLQAYRKFIDPKFGEAFSTSNHLGGLKVGNWGAILGNGLSYFGKVDGSRSLLPTNSEDTASSFRVAPTDVYVALPMRFYEHESVFALLATIGMVNKLTREAVSEL